MKYKGSITVNKDGTIVYKRIAVQTMGDGKRKQYAIERRKVDGLNLFNSLNLSVPKKRLSEILILPERTRFFQDQGDYLMVVIEDDPQIRNTFWDWDTIEDEYRQVRGRKSVKKDFGVKKPGELKKTTFQLAFPYILYFLLFHQGIFNGMWLFYRTEPLRSEKDILLVSNLLNIGSGQEVCLGNGREDINKSQSISRQTSDAIQGFWNSRFNGELTGRYYSYQEEVKEFETVWDWERASKENPLFPLRVCWEGLSKTVEDVLKYIFENYARGREEERKLLPSRSEELFDFLTEAIFRTAPK